ncbi:MAG: hypothetical protein M5U28_52750 [Sandaracinaceae bacterium]|nr:hypothetical protein [Sandaracinaceae bacterium]
MDQFTYATSFTPKTSLPTAYYSVQAPSKTGCGFLLRDLVAHQRLECHRHGQAVLVEPAADAPLAALDETVFRWGRSPAQPTIFFEISSV